MTRTVAVCLCAVTIGALSSTTGHARPVRIGRYVELPFGISDAHPYPTDGGGPRRTGRVRGRIMGAAPSVRWEAQLRAALAGYRWQLGGENVGVGGSLESLEDAFMASPDHRKNILRKIYGHAAVGIVRQDDRIWITVIFYG